MPLVIKKHFISFTLIYFAIYCLWLFLFQGQAWVQILGGDLFSITAIGAGAALLYYTYKKTKGFDRTFWLLVLIGVVSYFIGELIWIYYELILRVEVPYPGWADVFYLATVIIHLTAVTVKLYKERHRYNTSRLLLDTLIVVVVSSTFCIHFLILPMIEEIGTFSFSMLVSIAYPVADVLLLSGVVNLYMGSADILPSKTRNFILAALAVQLFADTSYTIVNVLDEYISGSYLDPLWVLAIVLIGAAGFYSLDETSRDKAMKPMEPAEKKLGFNRYALPYFTVFILLITLLWLSEVNLLLAGFSVAVFFIIIRQITILRENGSLVRKLRSFNEELEFKVTQRTDEIMLKNKQLEFIAHYDSLSGLPNRRRFEQLLEQEIRRFEETSQGFGVAFFDLDRFKMINDTFGHTFGDQLIRQVGERLLEAVKKEHVASRFGGDEFTLIIRNAADRKAAGLAIEEIRGCFAKPFLINGTEVHVTLSMGIAMYPQDGTSPEELIKYADAAMYRAKQLGKDNYQFFTDDLKENYKQRLELENELRRALEKEQFEIHYQPQMNIAAGEAVGAEALVRWRHPVRGLVPPNEFIPIVEDTGLIIPLGEWIIRTVCRQIKAWADEGLPVVKIGVNLSARQFQTKSIVDSIRTILEETGIDPAYLQLEITESMAMSNNNLIQTLEQLEGLGVHISIDDFGTGHSSLLYLKKFPIQGLKISKEFIQELHEAQNQAIVAAIITMGKHLHLNVTAEGVEYEEQAELLQAMGCDDIQGYLYSKPLPRQQFEQFMMHKTGLPS